MNKKYVPKGYETVRAEQWLHDDCDQVTAFIKMLVDSGMTFCFTTSDYEDTVDIEVRGAGGRLLCEVEHEEWLIVKADKSVATMDTQKFRAAYEEAK